MTELLPVINANFEKWKLLVTHTPLRANVKHSGQVPRNENAEYAFDPFAIRRTASDAGRSARPASSSP